MNNILPGYFLSDNTFQTDCFRLCRFGIVIALHQHGFHSHTISYKHYRHSI